MGRKKIDIKPIEDERNRKTSFSKRKSNLLKKAYELSVLGDCEIGIVIFSRENKLYEFGSANINQVLLRYSKYTGEHESSTNQTISELLNKTQTKTGDLKNGNGGQLSEDSTMTPSLPQQQGIDTENNYLQQQQQSQPWQSATNFAMKSSEFHGLQLQQLGQQFGQQQQQQEQQQRDYYNYNYNNARQIPRSESDPKYGSGTWADKAAGAGAEMSTFGSGNYASHSQQSSPNCGWRPWPADSDSPGSSRPLKKFRSDPDPDTWLGIPESIYEYSMDQAGNSSRTSAMDYRQDQGLISAGSGWWPSQISSIATPTTAPPEKIWFNSNTINTKSGAQSTNQQLTAPEQYDNFLMTAAACASNRDRDPYCEDLLMSARDSIQDQPEDQLMAAIALIRDQNEDVMMEWLGIQPISPPSPAPAEQGRPPPPPSLETPKNCILAL